MKGKIKYFILACTIILILVVVIRLPEIKYRLITRTLISIDSESFKELYKEGDKGIVYFSRLTCPYCVENINQIKCLKKHTKIPIYYYDTENPTEETKSIFKDNNVEYVPSILFIKDQKTHTIDALLDSEAMLRALEDILIKAR